MCEMFVDNDVLIKLSAFDLLHAIVHPDCAAGCQARAGVLGAAPFVVRKRLGKRVAGDPSEALSRFEAFMAEARLLEPSPEELETSVNLEEAALRLGAELDAGESQLCAISLHRGLPLVLTGDKRAIEAAERLLSEVPDLIRLTARLACLEQAAVLAVHRLGALEVRRRVVAQPEMDRALSICFSYTNPYVPDDFYPTGLKSYIEDVRKSAPTVLLPGLVLRLGSTT